MTPLCHSQYPCQNDKRHYSKLEQRTKNKAVIIAETGNHHSSSLLSIFALPGLNSPPLGPNSNFISREDNCIEKANESSAMPIFIFMIAQLLLGCGGSPLFTLGTTYIDNHVKRDDSSMYIGIMYSMCAFGPVCGFLLGAYLLSHYVDTGSVDLVTLAMGELS